MVIRRLAGLIGFAALGASLFVAREAAARDVHPDRLLEPGGVIALSVAIKAKNPDRLLAPSGFKSSFVEPRTPSKAPSDPDGLMEPSADARRSRRSR